MSPRQTALGRLLQSRREAAGHSRTRIGELVGIKVGTVEGWELGRVAKPPIHDVLRLAHFLDISAEDVEAAVFEDTPLVSPEGELAAVDRERRGPRRRRQSAVPLLEAAFRLFDWRSETEAGEALNIGRSGQPVALGSRADAARRLPYADFADRRCRRGGDAGRRSSTRPRKGRIPSVVRERCITSRSSHADVASGG